jgi:hypothetical protein
MVDVVSTIHDSFPTRRGKGKMHTQYIEYGMMVNKYSWETIG